MTDLPAAAITAADDAYLACMKHYGHETGWAPGAVQGEQLVALHEALEAAAPHITAAAAAAERDRIIALASQLRAAIPADHPRGAQASFADYLRVTSQPEGDAT